MGSAPQGRRERPARHAPFSPKGLALVLAALAAAIACASTRADDGPLSPAESATRFVVHDDLAFDQVLAEPAVKQPVSLSFDERGRMWVVQYIQYPHPAGLTIVSRDRF